MAVIIVAAAGCGRWGFSPSGLLCGSRQELMVHCNAFGTGTLCLYAAGAVGHTGGRQVVWRVAR